MNQDKKYSHCIKEANQQGAIRQPRIFQPVNHFSHFSRARQPGFEYILEEEDEIGPKVYCQTCQTAYYEFEIPDHLRQCVKRHVKHAEDPQKNQEAKDKVLEIKAEDNRKGISLLQKQEIKADLHLAQPSQKDELNQSLLNESLAELIKFEESINKISRIVENKSALENEKRQMKHIEQQFTSVPCPFCTKSVPLSDLEHIDRCQLSIQCQHCKDKYPLALYEPHLMVCNLNPNPKKNSLFNLFSFSKFRPSRIFNRRDNSRQIRLERPQGRQIQNNHRIRLPQPAIERQRINAEALEEESRIRRGNLKGLSKEQLNRLTSQIYFAQEGREQDFCAICTAEIVAGQSVNELACKHTFHRCCLVPWLEQRSTCPTCKARVVK